MSIIYDALQKAQRKRLNKANVDTTNASSSKQSNHEGRMSVASIIIIVNIVLILSLLAFSKIYHSIRDYKKVAIIKPKPLPVKKSKPLEIAINEKFNLSGMFISDEEKLVVINNKTLREGDHVDGAKIIHINPDTVTLSLKGRIYRLKSDLNPN